jgi:hypothetical protein
VVSKESSGACNYEDTELGSMEAGEVPTRDDTSTLQYTNLTFQAEVTENDKRVPIQNKSQQYKACLH